MPTETMMFSPSGLPCREAVAREIPLERWEKKWRGHVTGDHSGEWPRMHSQWFPPAWAMKPEHTQLDALPYQWPLNIDLLPADARPQTAEKQLPEEQWEKMCGAALRRAGHRCEICGSAGAEQAAGVHEVWAFDDLWKNLHFERLQVLCPCCRKVKRIDETCDAGHAEEAARHLARVNDWPGLQAELYVNQKLLHWRARSRFEWSVDLGPLATEAFQQWLWAAPAPAESPRPESPRPGKGPGPERSSEEAHQEEVSRTERASHREKVSQHQKRPEGQEESASPGQERIPLWAPSSGTPSEKDHSEESSSTGAAGKAPAGARQQQLFRASAS